jgi:hypothetical protein
VNSVFILLIVIAAFLGLIAIMGIVSILTSGKKKQSKQSGSSGIMDDGDFEGHTIGNEEGLNFGNVPFKVMDDASRRGNKIQSSASRVPQANESFTQYSYPDDSAVLNDDKTITDDYEQDATVMNELKTQVMITCTFGEEEKNVTMTTNEVYVGRHQNNDISFTNDSKLSRRHASLKLIDGKLMLYDEKSANGTYLNGNRITEPVEVGSDSFIQVGATKLKIKILDGI